MRKPNSIIVLLYIQNQMQISSKPFCLGLKIYVAGLANCRPRYGFGTTACNNTFFRDRISIQKKCYCTADDVSSWNIVAASRYRELSEVFWPITSENKIWIYNNHQYSSNIHHYYLLKIIQEFWLAKSCRWNRHIRSVAAQIWSWKQLYHVWRNFVVHWKQLYHVWRNFVVHWKTL